MGTLMTKIRQKVCHHRDLELVAICHNNEANRGPYGQTSTLICKCKKCGKNPYYLDVDGIWIEMQQKEEINHDLRDAE